MEADFAPTEVAVALTTLPDRAGAEALARGAVEARLAACAQVDAPTASYYVWQGRLETATEHRVWFKFPATLEDALTAWVARHHPYEVPQWVVLRGSAGAAYLAWVRQQTPV